jgi:hypothetical protein
MVKINWEQPMTRVWMMVYGAVGAVFFLFTMLYAAGIAGSLLGSRPIDVGVRGGGRLLESIHIDVGPAA